MDDVAQQPDVLRITLPYSIKIQTWSKKFGLLSEMTTDAVLLPTITALDMRRIVPLEPLHYKIEKTKGPLWHNNSCALDSVLVLMKDAALGQLRADTRDVQVEGELPFYREATATMLRANWALLKKLHLSLIRNAIASYCQGNDVPYKHSKGNMLTVESWWRALAPLGRQSCMTVGTAYVCMGGRCDFFALCDPDEAPAPASVTMLEAKRYLEGTLDMSDRVQGVFDAYEMPKRSAACPRCKSRLGQQTVILDRLAPLLVLGWGFHKGGGHNGLGCVNDCTDITQSLDITHRTANGAWHSAKYEWFGVVHVRSGNHFVAVTRLSRKKGFVRIYDGMGRSNNDLHVSYDMEEHKYRRAYSKVDYVMPIYRRTF